MYFQNKILLLISDDNNDYNNNIKQSLNVILFNKYTQFDTLLMLSPY
jgi:hypothetical protein